MYQCIGPQKLSFERGTTSTTNSNLISLEETTSAVVRCTLELNDLWPWQKWLHWALQPVNSQCQCNFQCSISAQICQISCTPLELNDLRPPQSRWFHCCAPAGEQGDLPAQQQCSGSVASKPLLSRLYPRLAFLRHPCLKIWSSAFRPPFKFLVHKYHIFDKYLTKIFSLNLWVVFHLSKTALEGFDQNWAISGPLLCVILGILNAMDRPKVQFRNVPRLCCSIKMGQRM